MNIIDPTLEERAKDGYYFVRYCCENCSNPTKLGFDGVDVMVPTGEMKPKKLKCPNCLTASLKN